ncbi:hypothetical protein F511_20885 [Dorcoceras hygrometricum]|uniref:Uncharacterized protein n=1 Tax=Dorcoceras hygrometricum TaxID=472368 RepID=A0A2Z7D854_9LAMI|nr:hypothetical protein F511_20885 [Dorcoceras hygrometricum]
MRTRCDKTPSRKNDRKVLMAEESNKSWADTDSDSSSSSSSSSDSEQEEVHYLMANQTSDDEVFDLSNIEFTREDLVSALNDRVKEYRKLSHTFEEVKAENDDLKNSSAEPSAVELGEADSLKIELSKLIAENELLRNESSELKSEIERLNEVMSSWNQSSCSLHKLQESQKPVNDKSGLGFNSSESCEGETSTQSQLVYDKFKNMIFVKASVTYDSSVGGGATNLQPDVDQPAVAPTDAVQPDGAQSDVAQKDLSIHQSTADASAVSTHQLVSRPPVEASVASTSYQLAYSKLIYQSAMASSLFVNTVHVFFESVLAMDNAGMVAMFESLVSTGMKGFLGCPAMIHEAALLDFFENGSVRDGLVMNAPTPVAPTEQPSVPKRKTQKRKRKLILGSDDEFVEQPAVKVAGETVVEQEPVVEVPGETVIEGIAEPHSEPAVADVATQHVLAETAQIGPDEEEQDVGGLDVGEQAAPKADELEQWLNLSYEEFHARQAGQPVVTTSDTDEDLETVEEMATEAVEQSADEAMSLEDIFMTTPVECPLPSANVEITKITLGKSISIPGVDEGDWYKAGLPKIPTADKGKGPLWKETQLRGSDDKKGEDSSSRRPQPPPDNQSRPKGGSGGSGNRADEQSRPVVSGSRGGSQRRGDRSGSSKRSTAVVVDRSEDHLKIG